MHPDFQYVTPEVYGLRHRLLLSVVLAFTVVAAGCEAGSGCVEEPSASCTRVLFIGNSYTYTNDLPGTFRSLASSGGHRIDVRQIATGGATLAAAAADPKTLETIAGTPWTYVVLQEQSEVPAVEDARQAGMYPAVRSLVATIVSDGARPILFETWAHRDGWPERGFADYWTMQVAIRGGYQTIGRELGVAVAPVGEAWWRVHEADSSAALWSDDGSHPTTRGTYLAACVFYPVLFGTSAEGLSYRAGLSASDAAWLQVAGNAAVTAAGAP